MIYIEQPWDVKCSICGENFYIDKDEYIIGAKYICKNCVSKGIFKRGYWYIKDNKLKKCEEDETSIQTPLF